MPVGSSRVSLLALLVLAAACSALGYDVVPGVNRDLHGPPDVDAYIEELRDENRVRELQPERVVETLELARDAFAGDIGCGPGVFALPLARACPDGIVFAADVEPAQLDALRLRLREEGLQNVVPVLASYADPHFPPGRMDLLLVSDTFHHIEERVRYFAERVADLAPGGRLVIVEYKDGKLPVGPPPGKKVTRAQRHRELREAGWMLAREHGFHAWHHFEEWTPRR